MMKRAVRRGFAGAIRTASLAVLAAAAVLAAVGFGLAGSGNGAPTQSTAQRQTSAPSRQSLEQQFVRIVRTVSPSVVQIESAAGLGSGVVYDRSGHIVTNAHVVGPARDLRVTLADGRRLTGTLVGRFVPEDLASSRSLRTA